MSGLAVVFIILVILFLVIYLANRFVADKMLNTVIIVGSVILVTIYLLNVIGVINI